MQRRRLQLWQTKMLNETSYHGAGAIQEIATEAKAHGFQKAFVCSDPDLIKFGVIKGKQMYWTRMVLCMRFIPISNQIQPSRMSSTVYRHSRIPVPFLIANGGGSSMDTSNTAVIIANPEFEDVRSLEGVAPTKKTMRTDHRLFRPPYAAEVTINYVITDVEKKRKFVCVDPHDMPIISLDPEMMSPCQRDLLFLPIWMP